MQIIIIIIIIKSDNIESVIATKNVAGPPYIR